MPGTPAPSYMANDEEDSSRRESQLRLALGGLSLRDCGDDGDDGGISLPVVKGISVDYVHANIDGASVIGHQRRRDDTGSTVAESSTFSGHKTGSMPKYLLQRRKQWRREEEERRLAKQDSDCPSGHAVLSDEDRLQTLGGLKDRYQQLLGESNRLPVRSDTMRARRKKEEVENELNELDQAILTYSRARVFVKTESDGTTTAVT